MAVTAKCIIPSKAAESIQTTQYTAAGVTTIIDKFTATNTSGAAATLSVNLVTSGDVAGTNNLVTKTVSIAAGATYAFPEVVGHILNPGSFVSTIASASNALSIRASGREIT